MENLNLVSAFMIGMLGSGHCVAMCGGIAGSLSLSTSDNNNWVLIFLFQLGRTVSYTSIGALAGFLGWHADQLLVIPILKILSAVLLILMALYLSQVWNGLAWLERGGQRIWRLISPLSKKLLPVRGPASAVGLGAVWGWLPCGLVYTSLGYALALGSVSQSALFMTFFGLGTMPAMFVAGSAGQLIKQQLNSKPVRLFSAALLFLFGLWTIYTLLATGGAHGHHAMHH